MRIVQSLRFRLRGAAGTVLAAALSSLLVAPDLILAAQDQTAAAETAPEEAPKLSQEQLESLVAPIALYPDPLLSQCLVASTYPLDIMEAQQWLSKNSDLKGDALTEAAKKQDWDPSIQAMVELPDVMKRMSENIQWTTDLGNAFLAQENDVMNAVQALRVKAKDSGKLESNEQMNVETKTIESKTVVEIQPASTQVVYVPSYSPTVIWGPPVYPYPPVYYPPYVPGAALFSFGMGMAVGAAISGGGWGWNCGWGGGGNNTININNNNNFVNNSNRTNNINRSGNSNWQHNGERRGGVPYQDRATANKYGGGSRGDSASARQQQARSREAGAANRSGGQGNLGSSRSGGASAGSFGGGGSHGGGNYAGSRDMGSRSSGGGSAFSGSSGSHARSSSSRGASSMGSRGGGMSRGGGGRRR